MLDRPVRAPAGTGGVLPSVVEAIGSTPAVELSRFTAGVPGRIVAKLEYLNPGLEEGPDRAPDRRRRHRVRTAAAGQTVVELTSGDTGTGLSIVCAVRGHPFVAVMSEGNSPERARMMRALGAEVVLVPQAPGSPPGQVSGEDLALVEVRAQELTAERHAFRADQFGNPSAARAHEEGTAQELWAQAGGGIDAFCEYVGSGGTYAGTMRGLLAHDPAIRGYVVEPAGAALLAGGAISNPNHRIQGGGYSMARLALLEDIPVHGYLAVTDDEAIEAARRLAREEGIFGGFSSGAVAAAALRLLSGPHGGGTVAVLLADSGLKYLSTDLWE